MPCTNKPYPSVSVRVIFLRQTRAYRICLDINRNSVKASDCADLGPRQDGGAEGVRTPDLLNAIQALYQLSYDPIRSEGKFKTSPEIVKAILHFELAAPGPSLRA